MEISMKYPQKFKVEVPYDPAIPFLSIDPKVSKSIHYKDTHTPMFIVALFKIAK
jgi:hypothetical protein